MKKLKLKCGDFFHVEVVETDLSEFRDDEYNMGKIKLEIKDGPCGNYYLYFDTRLNPHLKGA